MLRVALTTLAMFAAHRLGVAFFDPAQGVSRIWPASGVALALLLLGERRRWPAILIAVFVSALVDDLLLGIGTGTSIVFAASNAFECLTAGVVVQAELDDHASFLRVRDTLRLIGGGALATASSAVLGAACAGATVVDHARIYRTWLIADFLGILVVAPLIVAWSRPAPQENARGQGVEARERVGFALAWTAGCALAFLSPRAPGGLSVDPYMLLPLLAWAALRFGLCEVVSAIALLGASAIVGTALGRGAFGGELPGENLLHAQLYLAITTVSALLLAASQSERRSAESAVLEGVSGRRLAEDESQRSAERLQMALEAARMGTWEWDMVSDQIYGSNQVEPLFGVPEGSFTGRYEAYLQLIYPPDRPLVEEAIARIVNGASDDYAIEHRVVLPGGELRWLAATGRAYRDATGRALRMAGAVTDVTARREADEDLRRACEAKSRAQQAVLAQRELLALFIKHTPASVAMFDRDMCYLAAAERWLVDYNLDGQVLIGRSHYEVFPDIPEHWKQAHQRVLAGAIERCEDEPFHRADGSVEWMQWEMRPWRDARGEIGGLVMFTQVITERKRAEEAMRASEERLRQAQKFEALGTLAGGIAHDCNNILGAIVARTELAQLDDPSDHVLAHHLEQIRRASSRATSLISKILSFSRKRPHERVATSLPAVTREVLELLRATLPTTVELEVEVSDDVPRVLADANQLHQVVMNLCTNAAQAMRNRGVLRVRVEPITIVAPGDAELAPGDYVRLVVADSGHGMDEATLRRIFDPFFTTKGPGAGTGLGLAVVFGIVKDHDGHITVVSEPDRGATFSVYLPPAGPQARVSERPCAMAAAGGGELILFVDDERMLCEVAEQLLDRAGYRTEVFISSREAWSAIERDPRRFAAVVTDLTMPGMTGVELAARIAKLSSAPPVILTSGYVDAASGAVFEGHDVQQVLQKPYGYEALVGAVALAVECRRAG